MTDYGNSLLYHVSSLSLADEGHIGYKDTNKTTPTLQAWLGIVWYLCVESKGWNV